MGERVLAHHDGIVDDDAQRHDETEEAHHVDAAADEVEHAEGRHEGDRDTHCHPECNAAVQKQKQDEHHQNQAAGAVLQQQLDALLDQQPRLVVDSHLDPRRPATTVVCQPAGENFRRFEAAGVLVALETHLDGRLAGDGDHGLAAAGTPLDGGDVSQGQKPARFIAEQGQALETHLPSALIQRPQLPGHVVQADVPGRQIAAQPGDSIGDVVQGQVQLVQHSGRHLDGDLLLRQSHQLDVGDAAIQQLAFHLLHQRAQLADAGVGVGHQYPRHGLVADDAGDLRRLRRRREIAHQRHLLLHLVQRHAHVGALLVFEDDARRALGGVGRHLAESIQGTKLLLEGVGDGSLHVLGAGTGPLDAHLHHVEGDVREELRVDTIQSPEPCQDHDHHEQIARHLVLGEDSQEIVAVAKRHGLLHLCWWKTIILPAVAPVYGSHGTRMPFQRGLESRATLCSRLLAGGGSRRPVFGRQRSGTACGSRSLV